MTSAEAVRLLYVATTRARDHLVLSLFRGTKTDGCPGDVIEQQLESGSPELCQTLVARDYHATDNDVFGSAGIQSPDDASDETEWLHARSLRVSAAASPPSDRHSIAADRSETAADASIAAEVRQLVRRWWSGAHDQSTDLRPEACAAARAILASEAVSRARASDDLLRDVPLLALVEGVFLEETADLVYASAEGKRVVIYAVDESPEESETRAGRIAVAVRGATGTLPWVIDIVGRDGKTLITQPLERLVELAIADLGRIQLATTPPSRVVTL